jgi:hypothetical protein
LRAKEDRGKEVRRSQSKKEVEVEVEVDRVGRDRKDK